MTTDRQTDRQTDRLTKFHSVGGVDTASTDGIFDISNLDRLGQSEVELVQKVVDGVDLLIQVSFIVLCSTLHLLCTLFSLQMEKKLEAGESIDSLIPQ